VGTLAGFMVFLCFLFLAVHVLVGLYATSVVTASALDGARRVAGARVEHDDAASVQRARRDAEAHVRELLGRAGSRARFDWSGSDADEVQLRVTMPAPRLLPALGRTLGLDEIDRTVRVRVERQR
jgi:hypothetical protein